MLFCLCTISVFGQTLTNTSSNITWKAYKTLGSKSASHFGVVLLKSGSVFLKNGEFAGGNFVMDMNSLTADDLKDDPKYKNMLERHLKSDDFFDTAKFPTSTFQIKTLTKQSGTYNYKVGGILTIKGVSKKISFPAQVSVNTAGVSFTSAQFTFNRKDFGLKYNIFEDMLISNEVEINVSFTAK